MSVTIAAERVEVAVVELAGASLPIHQIVVDTFSYIVAHLRWHVERCLQCAVV